MKILYINTLYYPYSVGGAEKSVQELAEGVSSLGNEVFVMCLTDKSRVTFDIVNGVQIIYSPLSNVYWPFGGGGKSIFLKVLWHTIDYFNMVMLFRVFRQVYKIKPDVIHTNNIAGFSVAIWLIPFLLRIPLVHTSRDYYLFHPGATLYDGTNNMNPASFVVRFFSFFRKKISNLVDTYVGISEYICKFHTDAGFFSSVDKVVIYNSVKPIRLVKNLDNKASNIRIGFIGRLNKGKGFHVFCDMAERYSGCFQFFAAGAFPEGEEGLLLKMRAESVGIQLLGFVDLSVFFKNVDVIILPGQWREPFGRVVVESALAGKVVYASKVGGVSELIEIINNVYDISKFGESHLKVALHQASQKSDSQFSRFTIDLVVEQYVHLYRKLCRL